MNFPTGTPVFISLPHFLYGSNDLVQAVTGLNPNFDEHSIFLDVEPVRSPFHNFFKRRKLEDIII